MSSQYRFNFSIGPVQAAISQARSVRDLWTGSYTISWLTARAAAAALDQQASFDDPQWEASRLVKLHREGASQAAAGHGKQLLRSTLPNTFSFTAHTGDPEALRGEILNAVEQEWQKIADKVHASLARELQNGRAWDAGWAEQIEHAWHFRLHYLRVDEHLASAAEALGAPNLPADRERLADELLARSVAAAKLLRPVKPHGDAADARPKCSITGEEAQMGPMDCPLGEHASWWTETMATAVQGAGERLRSGERLGAPALVKRLAWACYFSHKTGHGGDRNALKTTDTATIAAGPWIAECRTLASPIPDQNYFLHEAHEEWSGQWLHRDGDVKDPCPPRMDGLIRKAKEALKPPPTYYAVLMMDGDNMGERLRRCNREERRSFTGKLSQFAGDTVPNLVQTYLWGPDGLQFNQPVYAGGDDVLALLPLWMPQAPGSNQPVSAVALAHRITTAFGGLQLPGAKEPATMSTGIAVVHYKTDLR